MWEASQDTWPSQGGKGQEVGPLRAPSQQR